MDSGACAFGIVQDVSDLLREANVRLSQRHNPIRLGDVERLLLNIADTSGTLQSKLAQSVPVSAREHFEWLVAPFTGMAASPQALMTIAIKAAEKSARDPRAIYQAIVSEANKAVDLVKVRLWAREVVDEPQSNWFDFFRVARYLRRS